jgi:uncharacterized protein
MTMTTPYEGSIQRAREQKDERIKTDPLHWMNLAGLFWLEEGENSFGSDKINKVAHPAFPKPFCGNFTIVNGQVFFQPAQGVEFTSNHPDTASRPLITDHEADPDVINIGSLTLKIIIRGGSPLIRMWDRESPSKAGFSGLKYYPVKEEYRVTAKYIRYDPPKTVTKMEIIGTEVQVVFLGQVQFNLNGVDCTLEAEKSGDKLLLHFADGTNAKTTYGGGRRIYVPQPEGDELILDFNMTDNWPCAYTPYATCPIVPQENRLSIQIEAGELKYHE